MNSVTIAGLAPGTTYEFQVQVICSPGSSAYSASASFTTTIDPCSVPTGLSASSITTGSAILNWAVVSGAISYNIQYRLTGTSLWATTSSAISSVTLSGLTPGTTYEFQVQAVCSAGPGAYSSTSSFVTTIIFCPVPAGLAASHFSETITLLTWTASAGAISYSIHYRQSGTTTWNYRTASVNSIPITGLTPGITYEFQIQAICSGTDSSGYSIILTSFPTSVSNPTSTVSDAQSLSVYPNPVINEATISYYLSSAENVSIRVYNMVGQEISTVQNENIQQAGEYKNNVLISAPGVYFIKLTIGRSCATAKIVKL